MNSITLLSIFLPIAQQEVTSSAGLQKAGSLENLLDSALETKPVVVKAADREPAPMVAMEPPPLEEESGEEQGPEGKDRTKYEGYYFLLYLLWHDIHLWMVLGFFAVLRSWHCFVFLINQKTLSYSEIPRVAM